MRGFGGITESIDALFSGLGVAIPAWTFPVLLVVGFLFLFPHIRQNQRTNEARKAIRDLADGGSDDPDAARASIIGLAQEHPVTLVVIADEALGRGMTALAKLALRHLQQTGGQGLDRRRLHALIHGSPLHIEAELAAIESLWMEGMHQAARSRLARAEKRWPGAAALTAIAHRFDVREE